MSSIQNDESAVNVEKVFESPAVTSTAMPSAKKKNALSKQSHNFEPIPKEENDYMRYWVDKSNKKCVMLLPRKLSITWSDNPNYWSWFPHKESPNEPAIEAVELKNVCWLDITGKFDMNNLTPGTVYEVVFKVKLEDPAYGWDTPVNLKVVLPSNLPNNLQEKKVNLSREQRYQWIDVKVGEFVASPGNSNSSEITFSMYEHEAGVWKRGFFLKGVAICPKN